MQNESQLPGNDDVRWDGARIASAPSHAVFAERVHTELRQLVSDDQYRAWFGRVTVIDRTDSNVEFGASSSFERDWLRRYHIPTLVTAATRAGQVGPVDVRITLDRAKADLSSRPGTSNGNSSLGCGETPHSKVAPEHHQAHHQAASAPDETWRPKGSANSAPIDANVLPEPSPIELDAVANDEAGEFQAIAERAGLNPKYSFETFVLGECNRLPHAAAIAIGENPGCAYNPLFIHGNTGLGKTHLLQATCQSILRQRRNARVLYMSCEEFTNRYIRAIQEHTLEEFRRQQRSVDVLVIDDVQFLANKERTQEEFFHTFNTLYNNKCQIVISSDRSPQAIPQIEERLVSRFKWGLVTEMEAPALETRVRIVKRKSSTLDIEMPDDVAQYIAERIDRNIRELEGAVNKVVSFAQLMCQPLELELAMQALRGAFKPRPISVGAQDIMNLIAEEYSISVRDIVGKGRTQTVSLPRQVAMYLTRKLTDMSLEEVGRNYGNRDHTTVLYAVQKIEKRIGDERRFAESIDQLIERLQLGRG